MKEKVNFWKRLFCKHKYQHLESPIFPMHIYGCSNIFICRRCGKVKTIYGKYVTNLQEVNNEQ